VYALDTDLQLRDGLDKDALLAAMEGHVVGKEELVPIYGR
jgi:phosphatidylethanolamine-binding protein (PEBP) family uncharacterized protein